MSTHHRSLYCWICDGNTRNNIYVNITFIRMYIISYITLQHIHSIFFYLIFRVWPNKKKKIHCKLTYLIHLKKKKPFRHFITILLGSIFSNLCTHIYWHSFEPSFPRNFYDIIHAVREFIRFFIHSLTHLILLKRTTTTKNASEFFITLFMHSNRVAWKICFLWQMTCSYWFTLCVCVCLCNSFHYLLQNAVLNNIGGKLKFIITCSNLRECSWSSYNERVHSVFPLRSRSINAIKRIYYYCWLIELHSIGIEWWRRQRRQRHWSQSSPVTIFPPSIHWKALA